MLLDLQSLEGGVTYSASTALTAHPAIVESARLSLFPALSLIAHPVISETPSLAMFPALALSAHPGIVEKATLAMFPVLSLTAHPTITESATLSLFPVLSFIAHPSIVEKATLATFPILTLSAHPAISESGGLAVSGTLTLAVHPAVVEKGTLSIFPVLSLSAHPAIAEGGALLITRTVAFAAHPTLADSGVLSISVVASLAAHPSFLDTGGLAFLASLGLSAHPSAVEKGTLLLPVSTAFSAHPAVSDQARLIAAASLTLGAHPSQASGAAMMVVTVIPLAAHPALADRGGLTYLGRFAMAALAGIVFGEDVSSIELPLLERPLTALERRLSIKYAQIQAKIDQGRGRAGLRVGQPYSVYRIQGNAAVHYADPVNLVAQNVDVLRRKLTQNPGLETPTRMGTLYYEVVGDFTRFKIGDLFVQTDPIYGVGATQVSYPTQQMNAWILAIHAPVKKTLAARVDRFAQVYRPDTAPSPPPDTVTQPGYWESYTLTQALPLVLTLGNFALGAQAQTACLVPIGLQSSDRVLGRLLDDVPGMPGKTRWFAYVPPLPGFTFREGDILVMQDLSRYIVFHPYAQEAGFSGSQLVLERVLAQG